MAKRLAELDKKQQRQGGPLQAALVAIEPSTGYVRALVGGRNFAESPFNRATDAKRQPGSAFKPFVFAAALEAGFSPGTTIDGLDGYVASAQGGYLPGGEHEVDSTTLRSALVHSSNRAAVHLLQRVGLGATIDLANRVGLEEMPAVPSLALGTGEVSLLNLTSAYTAFANGGVLQPPVIDPAHRRSATAASSIAANRSGRRVLSESTAYLMASMLADVVNHGTGYSRAPERLPLAGRRQDRHDRRSRGRVVHRLHAEARRRRVGRLRSTAADHAPRLRERRRRPGLGGLHEGRDHGNKAEWIAGAVRRLAHPPLPRLRRSRHRILRADRRGRRRLRVDSAARRTSARSTRRRHASTRRRGADRAPISYPHPPAAVAPAPCTASCTCTLHLHLCTCALRLRRLIYVLFSEAAFMQVIPVTAVHRGFGTTSRRDTWWAAPLGVFLGLSAFHRLRNWAAFQGEHYHFGPYLSPFYSPELWGDSPHAWFGEAPPCWPAFMPFSPALLILPFPAGFRFTCYYYRGAYYKAFWADPPSCAVGEPRKSYLGENSFPLIIQNIHRYFM